MTKRGRKSAASLAIQPATPVETVPRPGPPSQLTDEEAEEWRAVVDRMPADWFTRETHALLVQYCRHVIAARRVHQFIAHLEKEPELDLANYERALKMQGRESQLIASLATKMRISQQSSYDKSRKRAAAAKKSPGMFKLPASEIEAISFRRKGARRVFRESGAAEAVL